MASTTAVRLVLPPFVEDIGAQTSPKEPREFFSATENHKKEKKRKHPKTTSASSKPGTFFQGSRIPRLPTSSVERSNSRELKLFLSQDQVLEKDWDSEITRLLLENVEKSRQRTKTINESVRSEG